MGVKEGGGVKDGAGGGVKVGVNEGYCLYTFFNCGTTFGYGFSNIFGSGFSNIVGFDSCVGFGFSNGVNFLYPIRDSFIIKFNIINTITNINNINIEIMIFILQYIYKLILV